MSRQQLTTERPADRRTRNDPRRERTRARLLDAATRLVHSQGLSDLSVSAITRRVGVHQSLFYRHFDGLDDCLAEVGRLLVDKLPPIDQALRLAVSPRGTFATEERARYFARAFDRWLRAGPIVELLIVHRLERSAFGRAMRPMMDRMRDEIAGEIWEGVTPLGVAGRQLPEVRMLADQLVSNYFWALEVLVEGRAHDRVALARTLAESTGAMVEASVTRMMGRDHRSIAQRCRPAADRKELVRILDRLRAELPTHDDGALLQRYGGGKKLALLALDLMARSFLPELCGATFTARYVLATPEGEVARLLQMDVAGARLLPDDGSVEPDLTCRLSLRTMLELTTGLRDPYLAGAKGRITIEGNTILAARMPRWFYVASDGATD